MVMKMKLLISIGNESQTILLMPTSALLSACCAPFIWVVLKVIFLVIFDTNCFGADPGMELVIFFGRIATLFLFLTLSVSFLRKIVKTWGIPRMRRVLGLSVFFYATLTF